MTVTRPLVAAPLAAERAQQGGLARAVATDESDLVARVHRERRVVDEHALGDFDRQFLSPDHGHRRYRLVAPETPDIRPTLSTASLRRISGCLESGDSCRGSSRRPSPRQHRAPPPARVVPARGAAPRRRARDPAARQPARPAGRTAAAEGLRRPRHRRRGARGAGRDRPRLHRRGSGRAGARGRGEPSGNDPRVAGHRPHAFRRRHARAVARPRDGCRGTTPAS